MATLFKDMDGFDRLPKEVRDFINDSVTPPEPARVHELLKTMSVSTLLAGITRHERAMHERDVVAGVVAATPGPFRLSRLWQTRRAR